MNQNTQTVHRINKFVVPPASRAAFLDLMAKTHAVVRQQDGFVRDQILEQESGPGEFNFVLSMEFSGAEVVGRVAAAVAEMDRLDGTDRAAEMARLQVKTDMGIFRALDL